MSKLEQFAPWSEAAKANNDYHILFIENGHVYFVLFIILTRKRKIASTLTFLGGCFAATNI